MQLVAEKRVMQLSDGNIETTKTVFLVETGETVETLMCRVGLNGTADWQYSEAEVRIKLVKPPVA